MKVQFNFSTENNEIKQDKIQSTKNDHLNSPFHKNKEIKEDNIRQMPKDDVSSKPKNKVLNSEYHFGSLESNKEVSKNISSKNEVKPNPIMGPSENIELLTPELQKNMSPKIIEKMCQAPKKKAIKGNIVSIEKMDCTGTNESLFIGKLNEVVSRRNSTFQKNNPIEQKLQFDSPNSQCEDEEFKTISMGILKRNKNHLNVEEMKLTNITKSTPRHKKQDFFTHTSNPFSLEDPLYLNNTDENINTSIGWELSDEMSAPAKYSFSLENTLELMKKSVSSSTISIVSNSSDHMISDCSSLSGFSEVSILFLIYNLSTIKF